MGDRSRSVSRCCGASDLHDLADVSHSTCGGASPTLTAATGALPCLSFWSLLPSVFTSNLPEGLALPPPASPFHHGQFGSQPKDLCQG